jgi:hypothetical protein
MPVPAALALPSIPLPWLLGGSVAGYLLVLFTNPVRTSLRDGLRCVRRYSMQWITLGAFGFAYALFQLALRIYFFCVLPPADRPQFVWAREAWRDPHFWLTGSPQSLWYLPPHALRYAMRGSVLPSLESVAGIFNLLIATFPLSAAAAVLFFINWEGHHAVLWRALRKRFGMRGWVLYGGIFVCALAALAKPLLYAAPQLLHLEEHAAGLWFQWAPVAEWLSFIFEYLVGVGVQIGLILIAYCWVRGLTFHHEHLLDFAIRRFSFVVKWSLFVMLVSSVFIHAPLMLKNFAAFQGWFPIDEATIDRRWKIARAVLGLALLFFATMQITLTFHGESLGKALRDHWHFVGRHWWRLGWFLILAGLHFYLLRVGLEVVQRALGDGTSLGIGWSLLASWVNAIVAAWLLASWVCLFKQCDTDRTPAAADGTGGPGLPAVPDAPRVPEQGVLF